MPNSIEIIATILFAIAIVHTFSVPVFARLAHRGGPHAGFWHLLSEVEVVFGAWAFVLLVVMALLGGVGQAISYMDTRSFTEPAFVFAIMVVAASRPILELVGSGVRGLAKIMPFRTEFAMFFITLSLVPLSGSLITEPAAMTLAALLLRDACFRRVEHAGFKYMALGVLFVNVSIGGVLTSYAAPPVLMVAHTFGWDTTYMASHFGWRAAAAVIINAGVLTVICRKYLRGAPEARRTANVSGDPKTALASKSAMLSSTDDEIQPQNPRPDGMDVTSVAASDSLEGKARPSVSPIVMAVHLLFLIGVVLGAHHPTIFLGLLMLFIGYTQAYKRDQDPLMFKEGLMVGFFLAGLVVLGGLQQWWLQDLLADLPPVVLFWGATALTAVTDNAALTYLGSLVEGTGDLWRYMLVAGAVTGGGLTVIANAPNPAGFAILKSYFPNGAISPLKLLLSASLPTLVAAIMFLLPNSI